MKCTCGHPDNYNYAIDNGLCNSCISEKLEQLEDENERLHDTLADIALMGQQTMNICICGHTQDEHEYGIYQCWQCDCEAFKASTGEKHDTRDWGDE